MNVRFLPGRWAENLTLWEAKAEPVRFGDHGGRGGVAHFEPARASSGQEPRCHLTRAGATPLCFWAGAA